MLLIPQIYKKRAVQKVYNKPSGRPLICRCAKADYAQPRKRDASAVARIPTIYAAKRISRLRVVAVV